MPGVLKVEALDLAGTRSGALLSNKLLLVTQQQRRVVNVGVRAQGQSPGQAPSARMVGLLLHIVLPSSCMKG